MPVEPVGLSLAQVGAAAHAAGRVGQAAPVRVEGRGVPRPLAARRAPAGRAIADQEAVVVQAGEGVGQLPPDRPAVAGLAQAVDAEPGARQQRPASRAVGVEHGGVEGTGREPGLLLETA